MEKKDRVTYTIKKNPKTLKQILEEGGIEDQQKWGKWTFIKSNIAL